MLADRLKKFSQRNIPDKNFNLLVFKTVFILESLSFFFRQLRQTQIKIKLAYFKRRQIRLRKISVIVGHFFLSLGKSFLLVLVPASRFVYHFFSRFQNRRLSFYLTFNRSLHRPERIKVFYFHLSPQFGG